MESANWNSIYGANRRRTNQRIKTSVPDRQISSNVSAALLAWMSAKSRCGEVVLRIEDLEPDCSRREYAESIMDDLQWLGLKWDHRAEDQSRRGDAYLAANRRWLSRRDGDCTLQSLRVSWSPERVIALIAWLYGLIDR